MRIGITAHPSQIETAAAAGYDYVELDVNDIRSMDPDAYRSMTDTMQSTGLRAEVLCGILPDSVRVLGRNVLSSEIGHAMEETLEIARLLGTDTLIFDCPSLRCVPRDSGTPETWRQFGNLIRRFQGWAAAEKLRIAIMPMRRSVCGTIRHLSEAAMIPSLLGLDRIGIAASLFNMSMEADSPVEFRQIRSLLMHVRVSESITNAPPKPGDGTDYRRIFDILKEIGYTGRITVEGSFTDFAVQSVSARSIFDELDS